MVFYRIKKLHRLLMFIAVTFSWSRTIPIHLAGVCSRSHTTKAWLSNCNRNCTHSKPENFPFRLFTDHLARWELLVEDLSLQSILQQSPSHSPHSLLLFEVVLLVLMCFVAPPKIIYHLKAGITHNSC